MKTIGIILPMIDTSIRVLIKLDEENGHSVSFASSEDIQFMKQYNERAKAMGYEEFDAWHSGDDNLGQIRIVVAEGDQKVFDEDYNLWKNNVVKSKPSQTVVPADEFWCECENAFDHSFFVEAGVSDTCYKHHYVCTVCKKVIQIGQQFNQGELNMKTIKVEVLDISKLHNDINQLYADTGKKYETHFKSGGALLKNKEGLTILIDQDCCGLIEKDGVIGPINVFEDRSEDGFISLSPVYAVACSVEELESWIEKTMSLEDFMADRYDYNVRIETNVARLEEWIEGKI